MRGRGKEKEVWLLIVVMEGESKQGKNFVYDEKDFEMGPEEPGGGHEI